MAFIAGKIWGMTEQVFNKSNVEIHLVNINPNSKCSKHKHKTKFNGFYILQGSCVITTWKNDYDLVDNTPLEKGDFHQVKPGEYHEFETFSMGCKLLEVYWTELDTEDIDRKNCGEKKEINYEQCGHV
jgi:quercetin dioxygenase-like cupin family protein